MIPTLIAAESIRDINHLSLAFGRLKPEAAAAILRDLEAARTKDDKDQGVQSEAVARRHGIGVRRVKKRKAADER